MSEPSESLTAEHRPTKESADQNPESAAPVLGQPEEVRLVAALLARDRKATAEFVQRYTAPVQRYISSRLSPRYDLVDDLVQEVFLAAWVSLQKFRGGSSLQTWLLGIARHKVEDYYRGILREALPLSDLDEDLLPSSSSSEMEWEIDYEHLQKRTQSVMAALPDAYRIALQWRYWEKRSAREVGVTTGRTEKAVERLLARARQKFREIWIEAN